MRTLIEANACHDNHGVNLGSPSGSGTRRPEQEGPVLHGIGSFSKYL